jgi:hypothetical protein
MATAVTRTEHRATPLAVLSSTGLRKWRRRSALNTTTLPHGREVAYLPAGLTLTAEDRAEISVYRDQLSQFLASDGAENDRARFGLIAKMLLDSPIAAGQASAEVGKARGEVYRATLADIPPWALGEAVRLWHRGEAPDVGMGPHAYDFAPRPARLRRLCLWTLERVTRAHDDLTRLLEAKTFEEIHPQPSEEDRARVGAGFKQLGEQLRATVAAQQVAERSESERRSAEYRAQVEAMRRAAPRTGDAA